MNDVSLSTDQNVLNKMDIGARVIIEITCPNGQSAKASSTLIGFKKGQYVFRAGEPGRSMFFVNAGSVAVIVSNRQMDSFEVSVDSYISVCMRAYIFIPGLTA